MLIALYLYTVLCVPVTTTTVHYVSEEDITQENFSTPIHNVLGEDTTHPNADHQDPLEDVPWSKEDVPDPQVDVWRCGNQGNKSHVCNPDLVLTTEEVITLDMLIEDVHNITGPCPCTEGCLGDGGYWITVVVVHRIDMQQGLARGERMNALSNFTEFLRREKFQHGRCENDVVILLATQDKMVYTAVGPVASETLTKGCVDRVYQETKQYFEKEKWVDGLTAMVTAYSEVFRGEHVCQSHAGFYFMVIGLSVFGALAACCGFLWLRKGCWGSPDGPDLSLYHLPEEQAAKGPGSWGGKGGPVPASPWWSSVRRGSDRVERGSFSGT